MQGDVLEAKITYINIGLEGSPRRYPNSVLQITLQTRRRYSFVAGHATSPCRCGVQRMSWAILVCVQHT